MENYQLYISVFANKKNRKKRDLSIIIFAGDGEIIGRSTDLVNFKYENKDYERLVLGINSGGHIYDGKFHMEHKDRVRLLSSLKKCRQPRKAKKKLTRACRFWIKNSTFTFAY